MRAPVPIPMGLRQSAQGCRVREATLGHVPLFFPTPAGLHQSFVRRWLQPFQRVFGN
jgi:hypothetical protein